MRYLQLIGKIKLSLAWVGVVIIVTVSCIDPFNFEITENEKELVIEGQITDQPGPYLVVLSTTARLDGIGRNTLGLNAEVRIIDDMGNEETLTEVQPGGVYITDLNGIQGSLGRTYTLQVRTIDGKEYQSRPATILPVAIIEELSVGFEQERDELLPNEPIIDEGHVVYADIQNDRSRENFYKISTREIGEYFVSYGTCELTGGPINCWRFVNSNRDEIVITTDLNLFGPTFNTRVTRVPFDFRGDYFVEVMLQSISRHEYNFWISINKQLNKKGTLFDAALPTLKGNIDAGPDVALGYFSASATTTRAICFDRSKAPTKTTIVPPLIRCPQMCINVWAPAIFQKPADFDSCQN